MPVDHLERFTGGSYDVVINCIGIGKPSQLAVDPSRIFSVTEKYDDYVIAYLETHRDCLCINFSSGIVYGAGKSSPVSEDELSSININHLQPEDSYMIAKINSEAKHRVLSYLNIIDLRVFAYFSRFIDPESCFFITELISYLKAGKVFATGPDDMVRDYIHPDDLYSLVMKAVECRRGNDVFDAYSLKPVGKFEMLDYFARNHGLKYNIVESAKTDSATGKKDLYYSLSRKAEVLGYHPKFTSMDSIIQESKILLAEAGR